MKKILTRLSYILIGITLISTCFFSCAIADLRTASVKTDPDTERAKLLLKKVGIAHGIQYWDSIQTYDVKFQDEFFGFFGKQGHPFSEHKMNFKLQYIPKTYSGRMIFENGKKKDHIWGIQSWNTYTKKPTEDIVFKKNKDIKFWLPTYQYFIEFPLRIQNANSLAYAGEAIIEGILCDGVLASWNTVEPQKSTDQYLIWINKDTYRIEKIEYTIREMYKFLTGSALFKDYKNFNGILIPSRFPVKSNLKRKGLLHEMRILDVSFDETKVETIRPNSNLVHLGDEKPE